MTPDLPALIPPLGALAREAGRLVMDVYATAFDVTLKPDASPVTLADERAEAHIVAGLRALTPGWPIVAEEAASAGQLPAAADWFWLVDPLDGTREFVLRNGEFTVNIGLVNAGRPVLGFVFAPALERLYAGGPGLGAWLERGPAGAAPRQPLATRLPAADGLCLAASRAHGHPSSLAAHLGGQAVSETRRIGSSLKFGLLAAGEADCYARDGRTMEWDTAAGHAVLLGAGGEVLTTAGEPLRYGKPGYENPAFIAWGRVPAALASRAVPPAG